jgi:hypothetical protein
MTDFSGSVTQSKSIDLPKPQVFIHTVAIMPFPYRTAKMIDELMFVKGLYKLSNC